MNRDQKREQRKDRGSAQQEHESSTTSDKFLLTKTKAGSCHGSGQYAAREGISSASMAASDASRAVVARVFGLWFVWSSGTMSSSSPIAQVGIQSAPDLDPGHKCKFKPSFCKKSPDQRASSRRPTLTVSSRSGGSEEDNRGDQERHGESEETSSTSGGHHSHVDPAYDDDGPVARDRLPTDGSASTSTSAARGSIGHVRRPSRGTAASSEQPVRYLAMVDILDDRKCVSPQAGSNGASNNVLRPTTIRSTQRKSATTGTRPSRQTSSPT